MADQEIDMKIIDDWCEKDGEHKGCRQAVSNNKGRDPDHFTISPLPLKAMNGFYFILVLFFLIF